VKAPLPKNQRLVRRLGRTTRAHKPSFRARELLWRGGLLNDGAEFLGLLLNGGELSFHKLTLQLKHFLNVFGLHQLLGKVESSFHIGLGVRQRGHADILGAASKRQGGSVNGGDCLLGGAGKTFESLARLLDALFGEVTTSVGI